MGSDFVALICEIYYAHMTTATVVIVSSGIYPVEIRIRVNGVLEEEIEIAEVPNDDRRHILDIQGLLCLNPGDAVSFSVLVNYGGVGTFSASVRNNTRAVIFKIVEKT